MHCKNFVWQGITLKKSRLRHFFTKQFHFTLNSLVNFLYELFCPASLYVYCRGTSEHFRSKSLRRRRENFVCSERKNISFRSKNLKKHRCQILVPSSKVIVVIFREFDVKFLFIFPLLFPWFRVIPGNSRHSPIRFRVLDDGTKSCENIALYILS